MTSTISAHAVPDPPEPTQAPSVDPRRAVVRRLTGLEPELEPEPPVGQGARTTHAPTVPSAPPAPTQLTATLTRQTATVPAGPADDPARAPGLRAEVSVVLRMVLEVLDRRRPPAQLAGKLSPRALRYLVAATARVATPGPPGSTIEGTRARRGARPGPTGLRSIRLCCPGPEVAEVSAVWRYRGRHRALAARFERSSDRWLCTVLRLG